MVLILTYHRVVETHAAIGSFFDVSCEELERHLRLTMKRWHRCLVGAESVEQALASPPGRMKGFLFTFDDGTEDHYWQAAPILEKHGAKGVFFVNPANLGRPGFMTAPQCVDLQARGHKVESHSLHHDNLTLLPPDAVLFNLGVSRRMLKNLGASRWDWLAPPGGQFSPDVVDQAMASGYKAIRSIQWGYNTDFEGPVVESFTINRGNAGLAFGLVVSPSMESAKKRMHAVKEKSKKHLKALYYLCRDSSHKRAPDAPHPVRIRDDGARMNAAVRRMRI